MLAAEVEVADAKTLLEVVDRLKGLLGDAAILLGTAADGRVHLVASVAPALVARGVRAGTLVKQAAEVVGGGGGGRDTMAQAGRARSGEARGGDRGRACRDRGGARDLMRVLALDYGSARCGCALSDPTGTIVTPIAAIPRAGTRRGLQALAELVRDRAVERVVVGLPLSLSGRGHRPDARDAGVRAAPVASPGRRDPGGDARRALHHPDRAGHGGSLRRGRALTRGGVLLESWLALRSAQPGSR